MGLLESTKAVEVALSQEVVAGWCIHRVVEVGSLVVVEASPDYKDFPKTLVFWVQGEQCSLLGSGENLVEQPFYLR